MRFRLCAALRGLMGLGLALAVLGGCGISSAVDVDAPSAVGPTTPDTEPPTTLPPVTLAPDAPRTPAMLDPLDETPLTTPSSTDTNDGTLPVAPGPASAAPTTSSPAATTATDTPATQAIDPNSHLVAQALTPVATIRSSPGGGEIARTLANPTPSGAPLVFLVKELGAEWAEVYIPVRPNGSTGWIARSEIGLTQVPFRVEVRLDEHVITVFRGDEVLLREPVGVGRDNTPTPGGVFFLTELLQPPDPTGPYGKYAYGLSGFSDTLTNFAGGPGVIGIHGTNDPGSLGTDVSHGCIRMSNDGITELARILPLGTPVEIIS